MFSLFSIRLKFGMQNRGKKASHPQKSIRPSNVHIIFFFFGGGQAFACELFIVFYPITIGIGLSPLPVTVANEGLQGSPTKNIIILVVTVTGRGDNPT